MIEKTNTYDIEDAVPEAKDTKTIDKPAKRLPVIGLWVLYSTLLIIAPFSFLLFLTGMLNFDPFNVLLIGLMAAQGITLTAYSLFYNDWTYQSVYIIKKRDTLLILASFILSAIWRLLRPIFSDMSLVQQYQKQFVSELNTSSFILLFILLVVIGPIVHELLFRHLYFKAFLHNDDVNSKQHTIGMALSSILISTALYSGATALLTNVLGIPLYADSFIYSQYVLAISMITVAYLKTKRLSTAIAIHSLIGCGLIVELIATKIMI